MTVKEIMERLGLKLLAGESGLTKEISGVYICDLLSWVMAHTAQGDAWVTIQTHPNVVAVATLLELSCIIVPESAEIEDDTLKKADEEAIPFLVSAASGFEICTALYDAMKDK